MKEKAKKDYYFSVTVCQIVLAGLLSLAVFFLCKTGDSLKGELTALLNWNFDGMNINTAAETLKGYFSDNAAWAVFGTSVTDSREEAVQSEASLDEGLTQADESDSYSLTGTGGEDIPTYKAAENASFAPVYSTADIISPIENGRYTSYFGYRVNPITGEYGFHTGLDIAAPKGTKIRAAYGGRVTKIGQDDRAGKYIFLTHDNGFVTFYCHCSQIVADLDTNIRQGETIALVGSTGWSTGFHLHFEVRKDGIRYNPLWLLSE